MTARFLVAAAALALGACALFRPHPHPPEYSSLALGSGVVVHDLVVPEEGAPVASGDTVAIHYELYVENQLVESSRDAGKPLRIVLGKDDVPEGLQQGILGMRLFGRRRIIVPPELAYGDDGKPPLIPPDATLTFEIELMEHVPAP